MSFFDSIPLPPPPEQEQEQRERPAWMLPDTVIPVSVPAELLLVRTDQVAVAVGSVRAYPNGFEFTVHTRRRQVDEEIDLFGDPFSPHRRVRGAPGPGDALRLGLLYADGRRTATTSSRVPHDDSSEQLVLIQQGGGSARRWDHDFWVHPLPPDGPVTWIASWLEHGVTETRRRTRWRGHPRGRRAQSACGQMNPAPGPVLPGRPAPSRQASSTMMAADDPLAQPARISCWARASPNPRRAGSRRAGGRRPAPEDPGAVSDRGAVVRGEGGGCPQGPPRPRRRHDRVPHRF